MGLKERNRNRLKGYDYGQNGAYFVTVCTHNRQQLLSRIVGEGLCALPQVQSTPVGQMVEQAILHIDHAHPSCSVACYVIMPDHIHLLLQLQSNEKMGGHRGPPLQTIIGNFKSYTTHCFHGKLWQRSFYDHVIRNEQDYQEAYTYIQHNPTRWVDQHKGA
ncbi:MAG: transposase [Clostridia bacterium]|nr:transposase [Clostridia bacterium]